jgi:hypothetical protein
MSSYESPVVGLTSVDPTRASDDDDDDDDARGEARRPRRAQDVVGTRRRVGRLVDGGRVRVAIACGGETPSGDDERDTRK